MVTRRVDEWLVSGSCVGAGVEVTWGPHPPQFSAIAAAHRWAARGVHGLPLTTFNMAKLCFGKTSYCFWPLLDRAGQMESLSLSVEPLAAHLTRLISTEIAVTTDSRTPCWNVLKRVSRQLWRGLLVHWAVRCEPFIFSAVV